MSLDCRSALITGAGGAIGSALARALRARLPATRLLLSDRRPDDAAAIAAAVGGEVIAADLADPAGVAALIEAAGPVDLLVNNAGFMDVRSFVSQPVEVAEALLQVNLHAPLALMRGLAPAMIAAGRGWIVNVASLAGVTPLKGCALYGATKAGLGMASEVVQQELAPQGVRVLTVYPGFIRSPLERGARDQLGPTRLAARAPAGDPTRLATRIIDALERGESQLAWPPPYSFALRAPRIARRIGRALWPMPLD